MANLIDKTEIIKHRQISNSVRDDKINPFIEDAEFDDLKGLLGELLYNDIVDNPTDQQNIDLLDPFTYTYDSNQYKHKGLKKVLSIFSYARYIMFGSFTDTGFGFVEKNSQDSSNAELAQKKIVYKKEQQMAHKYFNEIKRFLDRNADTYTLWNADCQTQGARSIRINKITI